MIAPDVRQVLADPAQGGAYFVDARESDALADTARSLDFAVARIELAHCRDKAGVLARFAEALRFPAWFGGNFDALADSLGDLSWWPAEGYVLLIEHGDAWREADDENFATLLDILNEAAADWGDRGVPFWALLPLRQAELGKLAF